jgi:hypothetical protein
VWDTDGCFGYSLRSVHFELMLKAAQYSRRNQHGCHLFVFRRDVIFSQGDRRGAYGESRRFRFKLTRKEVPFRGKASYNDSRRGLAFIRRPTILPFSSVLGRCSPTRRSSISFLTFSDRSAGIFVSSIPMTASFNYRPMISAPASTV